MNNPIFTKVISVKLPAWCGLVSLLSLPSIAQSNDIHEEKPLEYVLVTIPIHKTQAETALPVTVLSGDELRRQVASTIGDTLAMTPGLSNASFGPSVGQPVIRGQQGARVTVLQNSTSSADASNISADHAVSVEPILAESIEVIRGPSTLLYGGGAIGGVVNVIDNRVPSVVPEQTTGALELRHGSVNDENTSVVKLDTGSGNWALHIDGVYRETNDIEVDGQPLIERDDHDDHEEEGHDEEHHDEEGHDEEVADGYIGNSDSRVKSITVGGSYIGETGYIGFAVNRLENEYGLPTGAHGHGHEEEEDHDEEEHEEEEHHDEEEGDIRLDIEQTRYDVRALKHVHGSFIDTVRWYATYSDYEHTEIEGSGEVGTIFSNEGWENRLEFIHQEWNGWHGVIGLQTQQSEFSAVGEESFIPETDLNRNGIFLIEDFHRQDWTYEIGVRYDRDELDPDTDRSDKKTFNSLSGSFSSLWDINEHFSLGVALSHSERAPTIEESFSNIENDDEFVVHAATGSIEISPGNLDTEKANNIDVSFSWKNDHADGNITFFYNDFSDYIYLANTGGEQDEVPIFFYSQQGAKFTGVEVQHKMPLAKALDGELGLELWGDYIEGELDDGSDVPRLPPLRVGGRLTFDKGALSANVSVLHAENQDKPGVNEFETDGYTRWDAGMSYRFQTSGRGEYLTFVKLKNITDEEIRSSVSFLRDAAPEGGRSIEAGIRLMFN